MERERPWNESLITHAERQSRVFVAVVAAVNTACDFVFARSCYFLMMPDEQLSPEQVRIFRAMSGERRLRLAEGLYWTARKLKRAALRLQHADWPEQQIDEELRRLFFHART